MFNFFAKKIFWGFAMLLLLFVYSAYAETVAIQVRGAVKNPLSLSIKDLKDMTPFHVNGVVRIEEKAALTDPEKEGGTDRYQGVLLRDILEQAGMKFVRNGSRASISGSRVQITGKRFFPSGKSFTAAAAGAFSSPMKKADVQSNRKPVWVN
jgi:hypothetical protein